LQRKLRARRLVCAVGYRCCGWVSVFVVCHDKSYSFLSSVIDLD
jgi:hypothetical protein